MAGAGDSVKSGYYGSPSSKEVPYRKMLQAFADLYFIVDREGKYLFAFSGTEGRPEFLVEPEKIIGHSFWEFLPPEVAVDFKKFFEQTFATQTSQSLEYSLRFPGMGEQYYEARSVLLSESETIVVCRNITYKQLALKRERFLSNSTQILNSTLDYRQTLKSLLDLIVPGLADYAVIRMLDSSGKLERIEAICRDPAKDSVMREIIARYSWTGQVKHSGARAMKTKKSVLIKKIDDKYLREISCDEEQYALVQKLAPISAISVPLVLDQKVRGSINIASLSHERIYTEDDLALAEQLAARAVMAIARTQTHSEALIAVQLKDNVLRIAGQGIERQFKGIDREVTKLLKQVARVESSELKRQILTCAKAILRANEEIGSLLEEVTEATEFWEGKGTSERSPQDFARLVERALAFSLPASLERQIEIEAKFDSPAALIFTSGDETIEALRVWFCHLIKAVPKKSQIKMKLKREQQELVLSMIAPSSAGTESAFSVMRTRVEKLGGRVSERALDAKSSIFVIAFPVFSPN